MVVVVVVVLVVVVVVVVIEMVLVKGSQEKQRREVVVVVVVVVVVMVVMRGGREGERRAPGPRKDELPVCLEVELLPQSLIPQALVHPPNRRPLGLIVSSWIEDRVIHLEKLGSVELVGVFSGTNCPLPGGGAVSGGYLHTHHITLHASSRLSGYERPCWGATAALLGATWRYDNVL
jgi:hypothetical protein